MTCYVSCIYLSNNSNIHNMDNALFSKHPLFDSYVKYYGMNQDGKNDYEVGCIQAANVLVPIIMDLVLESNKK